MKQIRAAIRAQLAKLEKDSAARAKTLHAKYDQVLAQAQTQLTQRQRLDEALLVKNKRDEVAAAWLAGIPATPVPATAEQPKPKPPVPIPTVATASTPETAGGNLFKNPNFENGTDGWEITDFGKNGAIAIDTKELHNGKTTLRIELLEGDFVFVKQLVGKPNTHYRLSGYIKTKNVEPVNKGGKQGACLMVGFTADVRGGSTPPIQKTNSWKKVSVDFTTTAKNSITVGAGFGSYASNVTGTAWFSELSLTELSHTSKK